MCPAVLTALSSAVSIFIWTDSCTLSSCKVSLNVGWCKFVLGLGPLAARLLPLKDAGIVAGVQGLNHLEDDGNHPEGVSKEVAEGHQPVVHISLHRSMPCQAYILASAQHLKHLGNRFCIGPRETLQRVGVITQLSRCSSKHGCAVIALSDHAGLIPVLCQMHAHEDLAQ